MPDNTKKSTGAAFRHFKQQTVQQNHARDRHKRYPLDCTRQFADTKVTRMRIPFKESIQKHANTVVRDRRTCMQPSYPCRDPPMGLQKPSSVVVH